MEWVLLFVLGNLGAVAVLSRAVLKSTWAVGRKASVLSALVLFLPVSLSVMAWASRVEVGRGPSALAIFLAVIAVISLVVGMGGVALAWWKLAVGKRAEA